MILPVRKIGRRAIRSPGAQSQKEMQEKYFVRLVNNNPQYQLLIASLKEGVTPAAIASHFAQNSWIEVNERTFAEAIRAFKRVHPEVIENTAAEGLNEIVDPNRPGLDTRVALQQLLRMQQLRLGIEVNNEQGIHKLFNTTHKEVEVTRDILETIAKMDGKITDGSHSNMGNETPDVIEDLNRLKKDQLARDRIHHTIKQVVEAKA